MAIDIDDFPIYNDVTKMNDGKSSGQLSEVWMTSMATLSQTLKGYLSQNGIIAPNLTTTQRDANKNAVNGQIIYNTTTNKFQGYENGAWVNLV